jgi:hypothetical protein
MIRHLFFAIALMGAAGFLSLPAEAAGINWRCEDNSSACLGRCADPSGGAGDWHGHPNKCLFSCDRRLISCVNRATTRR